jgi:signal transduction histidine kinase
MLSDHFDDPEYRDTATRLLPGEVSRIAGLADRLRFMAPSEAGTLLPIEISSLLRDIIALHSAVALDRGVRIEFHCSQALPLILGDRPQLVQLFVNLLNNSVDSMAGGGTVTIGITRVVRPPSETVVVDVMDEGGGIEPSIQRKIFEPFFTTKRSGVGLGLPICREIADFHRARLALRTRPTGKGTIATVEFPAIPRAENTAMTFDESDLSTLRQ